MRGVFPLMRSSRTLLCFSKTSRDPVAEGEEEMDGRGIKRYEGGFISVTYILAKGHYFTTLEIIPNCACESVSQIT